MDIIGSEAPNESGHGPDNTVRELQEIQRQLTAALVESQDRLEALRSLAAVGFDSLGLSESMPKILIEAQNITGSDVTLLVDAEELYKSGSLTNADVDTLAEALELVFTPAEMLLQEPRLLNRGRTAVMSFRRGGNTGRHMVFHRRSGPPFATGDMALIGSVLGFTESVYELARLHQREVEHAKFEREHIAASGLAQAALELPLPEIAGAELFGTSVPASVAGGDLFLAVETKGRLWFVVGDVAGKGLPAALVMTRAVSAARAAFLGCPSGGADEALRTISDELFEYLGSVGLFITLAVGCYDTADQSLEISNAGHSPVLLIRPSGHEQLPSTSPPVGVLPPGRHSVIRRQLGEGDVLVIGSDGLVEQTNKAGELFGYSRFADVCQELSGRYPSAAGLGQAVFSRVARFAEGVAPSDDRTMLVIRVGEKVTSTEVSVQANALGLREIGPWLERSLSILPPEEADELRGRLELAAHEVAMNIVDHSGLSPTDTMAIHLHLGASAAELHVTAAGKPFDLPAGAPIEPNEPQIRGYGLIIVSKLVDELSVKRAGNLNRWTLKIARVRNTGEDNG